MGEIDGDLVLIPGHDLPHAVLVGRVEVWERRALQHSLLFVDVATARIWNTGGVSQRELLVRRVSAYSKPQFLAPFIQEGGKGREGKGFEASLFFLIGVPPHASGGFCHSAVRQSCRSLQLGWGECRWGTGGLGWGGGCTKPIKDGLCSKLNFHLVDVHPPRASAAQSCPLESSVLARG